MSARCIAKNAIVTIPPPHPRLPQLRSSEFVAFQQMAVQYWPKQDQKEISRGAAFFNYYCH